MIVADRLRSLGQRRRPWFHASFYRLANPDLIGYRRSAWSHYCRFGRFEGRSPHPLIDMAGLARQLPEALPGDLLHTYLQDRRHWLLSPGPYVDAEAFVLRGPWDGRTNPLVQILRDFPVEPWVRSRLGVIDLGAADEGIIAAAGVLVGRNPGLASIAPLSGWRIVPSLPTIGPGEYRVVPGGFIGRDAVGIVLGDRVVSADGTFARSGRVAAMLDVGPTLRVERLEIHGEQVFGDGMPLPFGVQTRVRADALELSAEGR